MGGCGGGGPRSGGTLENTLKHGPARCHVNQTAACSCHSHAAGPLFDPKTKVVPKMKRDELERVSGETATFWGTSPGPKIQTFSDSGRGSIGRTDENSDQKMDQNVAKTNLVPDGIRAKKVSKRHEMAAIR